MEYVFTVLFVVGFLYLCVRRWKQWRNMTPDEQRADRTERRISRVERDLQRHKTYDD
jgi:threonine/homoserine/homoserine lactone efflux protein